MADETVHKDNDTPDASDEGVKRVDADTPGAPEGAAIADQGAGNNPGEATNPDEVDDPKGSHRPV